MDGLSLVLGVLTVIETAATAAETLYDFARTVHDAPGEVKSLVREANNLYGVLRRISEALKEPPIVTYVHNNPNIERDLASLKDPLKQCEKRIGELMVKLEKNTERTGDGSRRAMKGIAMVHCLRQSATQQASALSSKTAESSVSRSVAELKQQGSDLRQAAWDGDIRIVKLLLDDGAPVDSRSREGRTALSLASQYGYLDIVRLLLDAKPTIDAQSYEVKEGNSYKQAEGKRTPLHWAAVAGHLEIAEALLDAGANIEAKTVNQRSPVVEAAIAHHLAMVVFMLDRGADVNAHTYYGWNMLHTAASNGKLDLAELVVERGIDVEAEYTGPWTKQRHRRKHSNEPARPALCS